MLRLVILDFDGTLGDTRANIVLTMTRTLSLLGYPVPGEEAIAATIGVPLEDGFAQLLPDLSPEEALKCARTYREQFELCRKILVPKVFPHVKDTLCALKEAGYLLTVASSRRSQSLKEFLVEMEIAPYISYVLGADNVTLAKPHPEPVLKTLAELDIPAEEALVVGDMPVDIAMGKAAGTKTCAVTYGNASRTDLAEADFIIDDFAEMIPLVADLQSA